MIALAVSVCWHLCAMIIFLPFKVLPFLVVAQRQCHKIRGGLGGLRARCGRTVMAGGLQHHVAVDVTASTRNEAMRAS